MNAPDIDESGERGEAVNPPLLARNSQESCLTGEEELQLYLASLGRA
jgi:hypothetical protein